jgi:hypothetical protein
LLIVVLKIHQQQALCVLQRGRRQGPRAQGIGQARRSCNNLGSGNDGSDTDAIVGILERPEAAMRIILRNGCCINRPPAYVRARGKHSALEPWIGQEVLKAVRGRHVSKEDHYEQFDDVNA